MLAKVVRALRRRVKKTAAWSVSDRAGVRYGEGNVRRERGREGGREREKVRKREGGREREPDAVWFRSRV